MVGAGKINSKLVAASSVGDIIPLALVFALFSGACAVAVNYLQNYFFGKAVFFWSDGKTRYERNRSIINYLFFAIPISLAINSFNVTGALT